MKMRHSFAAMNNGKPTPFALLGHPVGHSLSPAMHNAAFKALGLRAIYTLLDVEPGDIPRTPAELRAHCRTHSLKGEFVAILLPA